MPVPAAPGRAGRCPGRVSPDGLEGSCITRLFTHFRPKELHDWTKIPLGHFNMDVAPACAGRARRLPQQLCWKGWKGAPASLLKGWKV